MTVLIFCPVKAGEMEKGNKYFTDPVSVESFKFGKLPRSSFIWDVLVCHWTSVAWHFRVT
jgi:hypothetical protein